MPSSESLQPTAIPLRGLSPTEFKRHAEALLCELTVVPVLC